MRLFSIVVSMAAALFLAACATPPPAPKPKPEPTTQAWYGETIDQLAALNREAENFFRTGKLEQSAGKIANAQPLAGRLLSVPRPTLAAMEAASDFDDLYGRMLLANRHDGWARLQFQKNLIRWKNWKPATENTARRRKQAEAAIAECDRRLEK
jgi:hypothetical protein